MTADSVSDIVHRKGHEVSEKSDLSDADGLVFQIFDLLYCLFVHGIFLCIYRLFALSLCYILTLAKINVYMSDTKRKCSQQVKRTSDCRDVSASVLYHAPLQLRNYIYLNFNDAFDSDKVHTQFHGSASHLRAIYKKSFGVRFHQDCINTRIAKVRYYTAVFPMPFRLQMIILTVFITRYWLRILPQESASMTSV